MRKRAIAREEARSLTIEDADAGLSVPGGFRLRRLRGDVPAGPMVLWKHTTGSKLIVSLLCPVSVWIGGAIVKKSQVPEVGLIADDAGPADQVRT